LPVLAIFKTKIEGRPLLAAPIAETLTKKA